MNKTNCKNDRQSLLHQTALWKIVPANFSFQERFSKKLHDGAKFFQQHGYNNHSPWNTGAQRRKDKVITAILIATYHAYHLLSPLQIPSKPIERNFTWPFFVLRSVQSSYTTRKDERKRTIDAKTSSASFTTHPLSARVAPWFGVLRLVAGQPNWWIGKRYAKVCIIPSPSVGHTLPVKVISIDFAGAAIAGCFAITKSDTAVWAVLVYRLLIAVGAVTPFAMVESYRQKRYDKVYRAVPLLRWGHCSWAIIDAVLVWSAIRTEGLVFGVYFSVTVREWVRKKVFWWRAFIVGFHSNILWYFT